MPCPTLVGTTPFPAPPSRDILPPRPAKPRTDEARASLVERPSIDGASRARYAPTVHSPNVTVRTNAADVRLGDQHLTERPPPHGRNGFDYLAKELPDSLHEARARPSAGRQPFADAPHSHSR